MYKGKYRQNSLHTRERERRERNNKRQRKRYRVFDLSFLMGSTTKMAHTIYGTDELGLSIENLMHKWRIGVEKVEIRLDAIRDNKRIVHCEEAAAARDKRRKENNDCAIEKLTISR